MLFTEPLLSVLPPQIHDKVRRLDADPANAALMAAAVLYLDMHGATFRHHVQGEVLRHVPVSVPTGITDHAAAVAAIREQLAELDAEWRATEHAPSKAADLKRGLLQAIDKIAALGAPALMPTQRGGLSPVQLDAVLAPKVQDIGHGKDVVSKVYGSPAAFFVWLLHDEIVERIGELIDAVPQDNALSDDERDDRFGNIAERRLVVERMEEALIVAGEAAGIAILRRPNADPCAVLEIERV